MKHEVSRRKIASPLPKKGYSEPKVKAKKTVNENSGKSLKSNSVKSAAVKSRAVIAPKNAKPKRAALQNKVAAKPSKTPISTQKKVSIIDKPQRNDKRQTAKIAPKSADKIAESKIRKVKPAVAVKQKTVKTASVNVKSKTATPVAESKARKNAPKVFAVKAVKKDLPIKVRTTKTKAAKSKIASAKIEKTKSNKIAGKSQKKPTVISAKRSVAPKATVVAASKKTDAKSLRSNPGAAAKKVAQKIQRIKAQKAFETVKTPPKQVKAITAKLKTSPKTMKLKAEVATKVLRSPTQKVEGAKKLKSKSEKIISMPTRKLKTVDTPIEIVAPPVPKPRKKKVKPLGAAIFRGKKERYDFQVFPTDGEFEDAAAIYIISRRRVDKNKRAHHKMVCIGQTASILSDLKKHRKGKCFKQYCANAISVLREENEQKRLKIEADLKSAHRIPCPHA